MKIKLRNFKLLKLEKSNNILSPTKAGQIEF